MLTKKQTGLVLAFLLFAAIPLWVFVVAPRLQRLPRDFHYTASIVSTDNFFDAEKNAYAGAIYSQTRYSYDTIEQSGSAVIVKNTFDVRTPDDQPIFAVERLYGIDRTNGAHVPSLGDAPRDGYLFAPRHLPRGAAFTYWHINYDGPARMRFAAEDTLYGLKVYRYETRYEGVHIDQTANLRHLPGVGQTLGVQLEPYLQLWIEPVTGRLIKYKDDTIAYFYDLKTQKRLRPWNHFSNSFDERSVEASVMTAHVEKTKMIMMEWYIPILFFLGALIALGWNIISLQSLHRVISPRRVSLLSRIAIILTALASFLGWIFGNERLIRIIPVGSGMNPLTAVCFVLLALCILFWDKGKKKTASAVGVILMTVGLLQLAGWLHVIPWNIDLLFFRHSILSLSVPARMAPYTALSFLLLGIPLLCDLTPPLRKLRLETILPMVVCVLSALIIIGHLFDVLAIRSLPIFFSAALHTAVLFFTAAMLMYAHYREQESTLTFSGWFGISSVLFSFILLTVLFTNFLGSNLANQARAVFDKDIDHITDALVERTNIYANILKGGQGLFASSVIVTRAEWKSYVGAIGLEEDYPGMQGMAFSPIITTKDRSRHTAAMRAQGIPRYTIHPAGERATYTPVTYIEPANERNRQALGFDMFQEPVRKLAMEQARDSGEPRMTGPLTLVQEGARDVQPGFIVYVPMYENGQPHKTLEERRDSIVGYISGAFRAHDFVDAVIGRNGIAKIALRIDDGIEPSAKSELYNDMQAKFGEAAAPRFTATKNLYVAGRAWTLQFQSSAEYGDTMISRFLPIATLVVGIIISCLIALYCYALLTSRRKAIVYAKQITRDIRKFQQAVMSATDGIMITDPQTRIIFVNPAWSRLTGYSFSEALGKPTNILKTNKTSASVFNAIRLAIQKGEPFTSDAFVNKHKDGTEYYAELTMFPVRKEEEEEEEEEKEEDGNSDILFFVGILADITRKKRGEEAKAEFVSLASHQLRTPLTEIRWALSSLEREHLSDEQRKIVETAHAASSHMSETIKAIMMISHIETGEMNPDPVDIDLPTAVDDIVRLYDGTRRKKEIELIINCPEHATVRTDEQLFKEIFSNLLTNAYKYSSNGGGVVISVKEEDDHIRLDVTDTGCGIPLHDQQHISQKFFRASNVVGQHQQGSGLGLHMSYALMRLLGGTISFISQENLGSTFTLTFPRSL
jgi:PAS domain S-box-containing protein